MSLLTKCSALLFANYPARLIQNDILNHYLQVRKEKLLDLFQFLQYVDDGKRITYYGKAMILFGFGCVLYPFANEEIRKPSHTYYSILLQCSLLASCASVILFLAMGYLDTRCRHNSIIQQHDELANNAVVVESANIRNMIPHLGS